MKVAVLAAVVFGAFAAPVLAEEMMDAKKLTCAEFEAMDAAGMMHAVDELHKAGPDAAMAMDEAGMKMAGEQVMAGCKGHPEMMAMDAMHAKM